MTFPNADIRPASQLAATIGRQAELRGNLDESGWLSTNLKIQHMAAYCEVSRLRVIRDS